VRVKADLTLASYDEAQALAKRFGIVGVPAVIFLDEQGQEIRALRLNQFEGPDEFLKRLQQIR
jgi:thiol:disulfide interchange protein DsbD